MDSLLFTIGAFLVALAVLITVHELGHFWVARRVGVKVLRFSIGFGRPLWKRMGADGTEYVVAAVPLGGYVKMLDEREAPVAKAELPRAFNRQQLWKRTAIVVAGPLFNFLFAILAYWLIFVTGDVGMRPLVGKVEPDSIAAQAGFRPGDEILAVGERVTPTWESAVYALLAESLEGQDLGVRVRESQGGEQTLWLDAQALAGLREDPEILQHLGLSPQRPLLPPVIGELLPGEPAAAAGLRPGDRLLAVDGRDLASWQDWVEYVRSHPGQALALTIERDGKPMRLEVTPRPVARESGEIGRIGASVQVPEGLLEKYRAEVRLGPVDAAGAAVRKTGDLSLLMLKMLGRMLTGQASIDNLSGPISIAETAGKSASYGFTYFLKFLAVVSISLGVLNLLPVPVLDGGHLLFFLIEAVKGSPLSEQAQLQGQRIGIVLLLALMSLAFYVDLSRLLG